MKLFIALTAVICLYLTSPLQAQYPDSQTGLTVNPIGGRVEHFSGIGIRSAEFLGVPTSARGLGMGEACTAATDDIGSMYWNPAGLGLLTGNAYQFTRVDMTTDFSLTYAAAAIPFSDGRFVVGGFFSFLNVEPEEITTITSPNGTGSYFDSYSSAAAGSFAYNISDRFSAGINVKWVHEDIWDITANAFSMDIGANYHTSFMGREIKFALCLKDLGTNLTYRGRRLYTEVDPEPLQDESGNYFEPDRGTRLDRYAELKSSTFNLPTSFRLGLAYTVLENSRDRLNVSGEYIQPNNLDMAFAVGAEYMMHLSDSYMAAVRTGWKYRGDELDISDDTGTSLSDSPAMRGFSMGASFVHDFSFFACSVDYAYYNQGLIGSWNAVSISVFH